MIKTVDYLQIITDSWSDFL